MIPYEEKRTLKWFLAFFYIIYFGYDLLYYYLFPAFISHKKAGLPSQFWYINYIVIIALIPVVYYLNKKNKQNKIKYVFFLTFITTAFIVDVLSYYGKGQSYASGNMVEVY